MYDIRRKDYLYLLKSSNESSILIDKTSMKSFLVIHIHSLGVSLIYVRRRSDTVFTKPIIKCIKTNHKSSGLTHSEKIVGEGLFRVSRSTVHKKEGLDSLFGLN